MTHLSRIASALSLSLAACGGSTPAPQPPAGGDEATPAASANRGTLKDLQNGDRACYVILDTAAGELSLEGDFDLCAGDATALIGQDVTWTTTKANVQAASCQGDPSCTDSDEVDLVDSIAPAN